MFATMMFYIHYKGKMTTTEIPAECEVAMLGAAGAIYVQMLFELVDAITMPEIATKVLSFIKMLVMLALNVSMVTMVIYAITL